MLNLKSYVNLRHGLRLIILIIIFQIITRNKITELKLGWCICLYMHDTLQYKVRDDLRLGNDPETINSIFVGFDKRSGSRLNLIIGCIYRPPWLPLAEFNDLFSTILDLTVRENKIIFILGDFYVNLSYNI